MWRQARRKNRSDLWAVTFTQRWYSNLVSSLNELTKQIKLLLKLISQNYKEIVVEVTEKNMVSSL